MTPGPRRFLKPRPAISGGQSSLPVLVTVLALAAAMPWLIRTGSPLVACLLAGLLAQCVHGVVRSVTGRRLLQAVFWTFSLCYLAVPAVYQVSTRQAAWGDTYIYYERARVLATLLIANVAFAMFSLGAAGGRREVEPAPAAQVADGGAAAAGVAGPQPVAPVSGRVARSPRRTYLRPGRGRRWASISPRLTVPALYCAGALLLLPLVISRTGGIGALVSSRTARNEALAAGGVAQDVSGGAAVALVAILPGALALAATYMLVLRWREGRRRAPLLLLCSAALLFLYSNPFANTRYVSSVAIVSILFLVVQPRTRRGLAAVVMVLVIGVLGVYPLANAFRGADTSSSESVSLASNDFDGFQQMVNTRQYVEERGHTWGKHLASAALFFLPRRFWVDKAVPASIPVAENRGYTFTNLSLPLPGELYLEFGLVGTGIAMFGWGRGWRTLDEKWRDGTGTLPGALVPYLAIAQLGLLRGPVGSLVPIYASTTIFLVFALRMELRRARARPRPVPVSHRADRAPVGIQSQVRSLR